MCTDKIEGFKFHFQSYNNNTSEEQHTRMPATYSIAKTMRAAGIHADCNLGSNLATQAYTWPVIKDDATERKAEDHERPNFLFTKDPEDQKTSIHTMIDALNDHDNKQRKLLVTNNSIELLLL